MAHDVIARFVLLAFGTLHSSTLNCKLLTKYFLYAFAEEDQWQTVARTDQGPMREYSVSYQNLMPSSTYTFRIVAYNKFGISYPVYTHDPVSSLSLTSNLNVVCVH